MYKNQLQELAQRSCFNLPSYACIREGPDHAPRFKATVNFNGETFESPNFCTTLRQAEHAAAEVALYEHARRGPSRALAARVLDETGVYKNLLQETAHRAGLNLPIYTTARSGTGHVPVFSCTVELAGMSFTGEPAKTKKQAQKNAAMAAWSSLKQMSQLGYSSPCSTSSSSCASEGNDEQDQVIVARFLGSLHPAGAKKSTQNDRQCRRQKSALVHRDPNLGSGLSLYPIQYQSWAYPNFSPEMTMYRVWHQELATPQHSHLLTLPLAPNPRAVPQIVPLVRSTIQPDDCQYFPAREQETIPVLPGIAMPTSGPLLYLSNSLIPVDVRITSQATLQEIREETPGPGCLNANIQSRTSGLSLSKVSCDNQTELKIQETLKDDRQRNVSSDPNIGSSVQLGGSQPKKFKWAPHKCIDAGYKSRAASLGNVKFGLCNPQFFGSSPSALTPYQPCQQNSPGVTRGFGLPSFTGPVMVTRVKPVPSEGQRAEIPHPQAPAPPIIRTGIPSHSTIIRCGATNVGGRPSVSFMAPAVQIRSVMPVCSASPSRKSPESNKDGLLPSGEEGSKESENMSDAISRLGKLHI